MKCHSRVLTLLLAAVLVATTTTFVVAEEESTPVEEEKPQLKRATIQAPFIEQFTPDWSKRWSPSGATKVTKDRGEVFSYVGKWEVEEVFPGDEGLVMKTAAAHHAISAPFDEPLDNTGKTLVIQYEVKVKDRFNIECGGAYLKLLTESDKGIQAEEFSDETPYTIMFGPDKCGTTDKVHFIFRHKNPKTGDYEEKHANGAPSGKITKVTTLYTLVVRPDNSFDIRINNESAKSGNLLEDFTPPVNPPKEIEDPDDKKPSDWADNPKMTDPDAKKPKDWDEDAPLEILDEEAVKPNDWYEDESTIIPDPEAEKPENWDDEEDGDWVPPSIPNPKCESASGCGPWKRPMKRNPNYKGKWYPPQIDNPAYKGPWAPRKIPNPNYFEDLTPSNFERIGAVGFELWTMNDGISFDNIYIGHSEEDAKKLSEETWSTKYVIEKAADDKEFNMDNDPDTPPPFWMDPIKFGQFYTSKFFALFTENPIDAITTYPETAGVLGLIIVVFFSLLGILASLLSVAKKPVASHKKTDEPTPDDPDADVGESSSVKDEGNDGDNEDDDSKSKAKKRTKTPKDKD